MSTPGRTRHFFLWLLLWASGFVLVIIGINANARYDRDPDRLDIQPGRVESVTVDPNHPLAIYIESSAWFDFDVDPGDRYCTALSPDLRIEVPTGRIRYAHVDGNSTWMRVAYLDVPASGAYDLECIEHQERRYLVAAAVSGSRIGRLAAAGFMIAGVMLILGIPIVVLWRTIRWAYRNYNPPSKLTPGWPGR